MNAESQTQAQRARYLTSREFNALFAQTVQRFPCIWDRSLLGNRSQTVINSAWEQVAKILGNGLSAKQCKTRWQSLRNTFTAHLRREARGGPKKSYMNGIMEFIRPHTTAGTLTAAGNGDDSSNDCEVIEDPVVSTGAFHELVELSDDEPEVTTTGGYYDDTEDNLDSNDYDDAPAACQHVRIDSSDGDALFLLSMLPEMEAMDEEQKRAFKESVQALADEFMS